MSSSPYKKYHTVEIIKDHLQKLKSLKDSGLIKPHELVQISQLEDELKFIEAKNTNKPISTYPKG